MKNCTKIRFFVVTKFWCYWSRSYSSWLQRRSNVVVHIKASAVVNISAATLQLGIVSTFLGEIIRLVTLPNPGKPRVSVEIMVVFHDLT